MSLNLAALEHYPAIAEAMLQRDWDSMSHGIYDSCYLNTCSEERECSMDLSRWAHWNRPTPATKQLSM